MNRKVAKHVLVLVTLTLVLVLSALPASAFVDEGSTTTVAGSFVYAPTPVFQWSQGNYAFMYGTDTAVWEGDLTGTSTEDYVAVIHSSGYAIYHGTVTFTGSLAGREGTLEILFEGTTPGPFDQWSGTWEVTGGTGELANAHGEGTFWNTVILNLAYSGEITFDTAQDHIVDIAATDDRFETLAAAVTYAGLADALSAGEWTVFAPTDAAFAKLDLNADNIASAFSKEELTDVLLYHVLDEAVSSADAKAMVGDITMANGKLAGLKYYDGNLYVNDDSKVIGPSILASNGYIHVVDTVILPPWPREPD
jgi:uncharacterized surface protein with fasciclin (FAS1) repeats